MENKIKVGEYCRTIKGEIAKVIEYRDEIVFDKDINFYGMYRGYICEDELNFIKKHYPNINDIIECGDYVNGYCVAKIEKDENGKITDICYEEEMEMQLYSVGDIESIVTKEQFEAISYKVERNKE